MRFTVATAAAVLAQASAGETSPTTTLKATSKSKIRRRAVAASRDRTRVLEMLGVPPTMKAKGDESPPSSKVAQDTKQAAPRPLWADSASLDRDQMLEHSDENSQECDPDIGILSCGMGAAYCHPHRDSKLGGFCMPKMSRALQEACPVDDLAPGVTCDCGKFDNATKTGMITCYDPNYCLDSQPTVCGTLSYNYDYSAGKISSYGGTVKIGDDVVSYSVFLDSSQDFVSCEASVHGCICGCTQLKRTNCQGSDLVITCPGTEAMDLCDDEDLVATLLDVNPTCTSTSTASGGNKLVRLVLPVAFAVVGLLVGMPG